MAPDMPAAAPERKSPAEYSICTGAAIPQDRLEPIIRAKAVALGADVRLSTALVSFEQDAGGVTALLRERDGSEYAARADYLIAADGNASPSAGRSASAAMDAGFFARSEAFCFAPRSTRIWNPASVSSRYVGGT